MPFGRVRWIRCQRENTASHLARMCLRRWENSLAFDRKETTLHLPFLHPPKIVCFAQPAALKPKNVHPRYQVTPKRHIAASASCELPSMATWASVPLRSDSFSISVTRVRSRSWVRRCEPTYVHNRRSTIHLCNGERLVEGRQRAGQSDATCECLNGPCALDAEGLGASLSEEKSEPSSVALKHDGRVFSRNCASEDILRALLFSTGGFGNS